MILQIAVKNLDVFPSISQIEDIAESCGLKSVNPKLNASIPRNNGCKNCDGHGFLQAKNTDDNFCIYLCPDCHGKDLSWNSKLPTKDLVNSLGYYTVKGTFSKSRLHPDWKEPDDMYSPKMKALFYTMQRSILMNDTRGMGGMRKTLGVTEDKAFMIYEKMTRKEPLNETQTSV